MVLWYWWGWSRIPNFVKIASLQYLTKEVRDEVDFLHVDENQSFPQVDFDTLGIKVFKGDNIISDGHDSVFSKYSK